jgi:hypothetical protein
MKPQTVRVPFPLRPIHTAMARTSLVLLLLASSWVSSGHSPPGLEAQEAQEAREVVTPRRPIPGPVVPPPFFRAALERGTRSPDGRPGPGYWQVYTEYDIDARLDPSSGLLSGFQTIRFHNRSPADLPTIQLLLNQNIHAEGVGRNRLVEVTGGIRLGRVKAAGQDLLPTRTLAAPGYLVREGVMSVRLPRPVRAGEIVELEVEWSFVVPQNGAGRMGHSQREMYFLAYWYPKVAVFDDLRGWDAESYRGAEFYHGYGDFRVSLTVPNGWTVMATGDLRNPEEVYSPQTRARMAAALEADTMVQIATRADREAGRVTELSPTGALTYRFEADKVGDFTWTASNVQLWTGTSARVVREGANGSGMVRDGANGSRMVRDGAGGSGMVRGVTGAPVEGEGGGSADRVAIHTFWREYRAPLWHEQALYAKHSIEYQSVYIGYPYPWPHMTSVEGADIIGGGMEFPMLTIMGTYQGRRPEDLYSVTAHEIGHMWVPMIVGTNEKRYAWMDEGLTSFLESETTPDYWPAITDPHGEWREGYLAVARMEQEQSMMRHADYYEPGPGYGNAAYQKPATLLVTLRNLLGKEVFTEAYRSFIRDWAFKHPTPWDFFNTFARAAGQDLDWFWVSWYYETWVLDHAVESVVREGNETVITVADRGFAFMPARVHIRTDEGQTLEREIPVSHWLRGEVEAQIRIPSSVGGVTRVEIDPHHLFPDVNRANNLWER